MYIVKKQKPTTIKDSTTKGDYVSYNVTVPLEEEEYSPFGVDFQVSRTFIQTNRTSRQNIQNILEELVIKYLESCDYSVEKLNLETLTICSDNYNTITSRNFKSIEELKNSTLQTLLK